MAVCVRLATPHMAATQVACVRFVGSFVVLVLATRARQLRPAPGNAGRLILRGLLGGRGDHLLLRRHQPRGRGAGDAAALDLSGVHRALRGAAPGRAVRPPRWGVALALNTAGHGVVLGSPRGSARRSARARSIALLGGMLAGGALATASELRRTRERVAGDHLVHGRGRAAHRAVVPARRRRPGRAARRCAGRRRR